MCLFFSTFQLRFSFLLYYIYAIFYVIILKNLDIFENPGLRYTFNFNCFFLNMYTSGVENSATWFSRWGRNLCLELVFCLHLKESSLLVMTEQGLDFGSLWDLCCMNLSEGWCAGLLLPWALEAAHIATEWWWKSILSHRPPLTSLAWRSGWSKLTSWHPSVVQACWTWAVLRIITVWLLTLLS